jgi:hypothetical protein
MSRAHLIAVLAAAMATLASCTHYEPLSLHGAGSMRVEVEVYKGPVSLSAEAQLGQAAAVLSETVRAMDGWHEEARAFLGPSLCWDDSKDEDRPQVWRHCVRPGDAPSKLAAPDKMLLQRTTCQKVGTEAQQAVSMTEWRDCMALQTAVQNSEAVIGAACFIINTPAFGDLRNVTYLPIGTCNHYPERWNFFDEKSKTWAIEDNGDKTYGIRTIGEVLTAQQKICVDTFLRNVAGIADPKDQAVFKQRAITEKLICLHEGVVAALNNYASLLRSSAFRVGDATIRYVPHDREIRGLLASYAYIASEYGNQVSARTDTLQKVLQHGVNAKLLPTSDYLRGASNTDFIHLFDWLEGADKRYPIGSPGKLSVAERIRMAERLNADYYWEKVNQVYASGQGDVSMAFVKDALGNWDLKSFRRSVETARILSQGYRCGAEDRRQAGDQGG